MRVRALAALAIAAQAAAIAAWFALASPGPVLGPVLSAQLTILAALAVALACRWRRAPFAVALHALFPLVIAIGEFPAQPEARLPAALLALTSLSAVLALGIAARFARPIQPSSG